MVLAFAAAWWFSRYSSSPPADPVRQGRQPYPQLLPDHTAADALPVQNTPRPTRNAPPQQGLARPSEIILRAEDRKAYEKILAEAAQNGAIVVRSLDQLNAVQLKITDASRFADWAARNGFEAAPNFFVYTPGISQNELGSLDSFTATGANLAEWIGVENRSGTGVRVAVLDSGISTHPTFAASEIIRGDDAADVYENGHGTAVASLIAGSHPQAEGIAPGVTLLDFPVLDQQGIGDTFLLAQKIVEAVDSGARIMNLSLGATGDSALVREAIAYAQAQDVIVVAAAGNEGLSQLSLPAYLPGVVAVGAVDAHDQLMPFSNRGDGLDVVAPGYQVQTAWPDEKLIQMTGTSGAVPIVTGALATLLAREPDLSGAQAVEILHKYSNEAGTPGVDTAYGYGVLDLNRMLQRNVRGIYDAAVVSQYPAPSQTGQWHVIVQNQGTETLYGIQVQSTSFGVPSSQFIQLLQPGEVAVTSHRMIDVYQPTQKLTTEISGNYRDMDAWNDTLHSVIEQDTDE